MFSCNSSCKKNIWFARKLGELTTTGCAKYEENRTTLPKDLKELCKGDMMRIYDDSMINDDEKNIFQDQWVGV